MSERKVLNKYYPADYDPSKIPKGKKNRNATFNIRIMAPFNMRCNMCKNYIYKGKKFNSRKEDVMDEDYLGLKIFRFYIKCPTCVSEIAFKTDLKNTDYTLEAGAKRLFEAEKIAQQMAEAERKAKEEDELNPMTMLENRTKASQKEMDQIDSLEELREMNTRKNLVNTDEMIEKYRKYEELLQQLQMEKEEEEIKDIFGDKSGQLVKRLNDSDDEDDQPVRKKLAAMESADKPTDILAEAPEVKKPAAVWEKSVGSLSSKQKLKGLVVTKKRTILPSATSILSSDSKSASGSSNTTGSTVDDEKEKGKSATDAAVNEDEKEPSGNDKESNSLTKGVRERLDTSAENEKLPVRFCDDDTLESIEKRRKSNNDGFSNQAGGSSGPTPGRPTGLGLLGGYGTSDSDSNSSG